MEMGWSDESSKMPLCENDPNATQTILPLSVSVMVEAVILDEPD